MSSDPLVTIYIPCRNYGRFLKQSVESVLNQLYENWELILIDEASEDDTSKISKNFLKKYPEKIKFIKNGKPIGLQKLANHVLKIANGKYMMRLDADDWMEEGALLIMVKKLEASKKAGLIYGNYYYANSEGRIIGIEMREALNNEGSRNQLPPHGACTLFRTRALKSVGGYSEEVNAQDGWDLWYKLADRIGATSVRSPIFYYRQHDNSMSKDNEKLIAARSKIFEQAAEKLEGDYKPSTVAVIPVKESYPDFEGVPFQEVNGKSLLEIAILSASTSKKIDSIIISSESKKVLNFSEKLEINGKVPKHYRLLRKEKKISKGSQTVPIRDFMFLASEFYKDNEGSYPDIVIYLSLHAINRRADHIDKALNVLRINESDSVVSVQEEREPMFGYSKEGLNLINPGRFKDLSYQDEQLYKFNGCLIATWWEVLQTHGLFGEKISSIEMSYEDSFQVKSKSMLKYLEV